MNYTTKLGTLVIEVPSAVEIHPAWERWRFTAEGRYLVAPSGQHITQEHMEGSCGATSRNYASIDREGGHRGTTRLAGAPLRHASRIRREALP